MVFPQQFGNVLSNGQVSVGRGVADIVPHLFPIIEFHPVNTIKLCNIANQKVRIERCAVLRNKLGRADSIEPIVRYEDDDWLHVPLLSHNW